MNISNPNGYGNGDNSFQAAGGESGIHRLVTDFYHIMSTQEKYHVIFQMHKRVIEESIDRLERFLCGWLGGPRLYREKYGPINIPQVHGHLVIQSQEKDLWLSCMNEALKLQPFEESFKQYLMEQFAIPAERIRAQCDKL